MKWQYYAAFCWFKITKKGGLLSEEEGIWSLRCNGVDYGLTDGMNYLGQYGWELVAVQQQGQSYGGPVAYWQRLQYWYIFKRPA
jgi:hypothetical protein